MNFYGRLGALRAKLPGVREETGFEYTFGATREEREHITPPQRYIVRIISEAEFIIRLTEELGGKYDSITDTALSVLEQALTEDGTLTRSVCEKAEQILLPAMDDCKAYKLILAGHAHIDMNWMWSWQETVAATIATFTTMLNIMDEYPQFCFSQSQTSVYEIIDRYAPELHDRIKARIDEGRWEVTSSAWVETDKNMPCTESLLRHISCSKNYLRDHWGISPDRLDIDFSPDTFGHSANLPEIDSFGGVKYYYHCRGLDGDYALYRWRGQSGRELLVYREQYWYNSGITPKPAMGLFDLSHRCAGLKTGLAVYGVGDHGGGPTRRDVERGMEMQSWPIFPTVVFGTFHDYFSEAETVRSQLPLVDHELNFIFPGCYTTQSRIKRGNRRCEAALSEAETASAFAEQVSGVRIRHQAIDEAWEKVLFTHFHDILTGSCVQDSREYAMGRFQEALATANTETGLALGRISAMVDTSSVAVIPDSNAQSDGAGAGYNISRFAGRESVERGQGLTRIWNLYNNTPADKVEPVEITAWDWPGDLRQVSVTDVPGNAVPFQLLDGEMQQYWDHRYFRFLCYVTVPAYSYTTVVLTQAEETSRPVYFNDPIRSHRDQKNFVLENEKIRCEFDYATGEMISMRDRDGKEYLCGKGSLVLIDTNRHNSNAWEIGTHLGLIPLTDVTDIHDTCSGSLRQGFAFEAKIRSSRVNVEYTLDRNASFVRMNIRADWSEVGGEKVPVLAYRLPLSSSADRFAYDIPAGTIIREAAEADRPGLSYIAAAEEGASENAGIVTDCKYGFRGIVRDGHAVLYSTLINTATSPDPYPERGIHQVTLSVGIFSADPSEMAKTAISANRPLTPVSTGSHKGTLAPSGTFLKVSAPTGVVSAVIPGDGILTVRIYSVSDTDGEFSVTPSFSVATARMTDLMGKKLDTLPADGNTVRGTLPAHSIVNICMEKY